MTAIRGTAPQQEDSFGEADSEPVLMALHAEYYELIWRASTRRCSGSAKSSPRTPRSAK